MLVWGGCLELKGNARSQMKGLVGHRHSMETGVYSSDMPILLMFFVNPQQLTYRICSFAWWFYWNIYIYICYISSNMHACVKIFVWSRNGKLCRSRGYLSLYYPQMTMSHLVRYLLTTGLTDLNLLTHVWAKIAAIHVIFPWQLDQDSVHQQFMSESSHEHLPKW